MVLRCHGLLLYLMCATALLTVQNAGKPSPSSVRRATQHRCPPYAQSVIRKDWGTVSPRETAYARDTGRPQALSQFSCEAIWGMLSPYNL
jgi:hypothetical protein